MPLPSNLSTRTVTGAYIDMTGAPAVGQVSFSTDNVLTDVGAAVVIMPKVIIAVLDSTGRFTVSLPVTDDSDVSPNGYSYKVTEQFDGLKGRTFFIQVPTGVTPIDISTVAPSSTPPPVPNPAYALAIDLASEQASRIAGDNALTLAFGASASSTQKGLVRLATADEAAAGADDTRAVTPASLAGRKLDPALFSDATTLASYPFGESYLSFTSTQGTTGNWGFGTAKAGTVRTYRRIDASGASQIFTRTHASTTTPEMWFRGGDVSGWAAWRQVATTADTVQVVSGIAESALPSAYPTGVSLMNVTTGSGWTLNSGFGAVITTKPTTDRTNQTFNSSAGGTSPARSWVRYYNSADGGGGWTAWRESMLMSELAPASFTQATALTSYPNGMSRLQYRDTDSSAWDFAGKFGEVATYRDATGNGFGRQQWTTLYGGPTGKPDVWIRTSNNSAGWTPWRRLVFEDKFTDTGWVSITYTTGFTAGTATQLQYRVKDDVIYFRGGATGTFAAGQYTNVADVGAIPAAYRPQLNTRGGASGATALPCIFELNTDGSIKLGFNGITGTPGWIAFSTSYPIS